MRIILISALCACGGLAALGASGCGDEGLPADTAAKVGDETISVAAVQREARSLAGSGEPADARRAQAVSRLIQARWVARAAEERGISASGGAAERRRRLLAGVAVGERDITAYYAAHRSEYGPPRKRIAFFLRVPTVAEVTRARVGLEQGASWSETFDAAYERDPTNRGDALEFTEHRIGDKEFGEQLFAAKEEELVGPVRTARGVYLFQVSREYPGPTRPPARLRATLAAKARPWKLESRLRARYGGDTDCADEYRSPVVPECS